MFIGPRVDQAPENVAEIQRVFGQPNVRWLGARPHSELPAYLKRFDLCLAPYALTPLKHSGSPLRLYDYLATDKPVLFTPISEACAHKDLIERKLALAD